MTPAERIKEQEKVLAERKMHAELAKSMRLTPEEVREAVAPPERGRTFTELSQKRAYLCDPVAQPNGTCSVDVMTCSVPTCVIFRATQLRSRQHALDYARETFDRTFPDWSLHR